MSALVLLGAVAGIGKYLADQFDTVSGQPMEPIPNPSHYDSIYESHTVAQTQQHMTHIAQQRTEQALDPASGLVRPMFNQMDSYAQQLAQTGDHDEALRRVKSNMVPFHRGQQTKQSLNFDRVNPLEQMAGGGQGHLVASNKVELPSFYDATERFITPGDDPGKMRDLSRFEVSRLKNSEMLAEPERVAPTINNSTFRPQPKTLSELRIQDRPLLEGRLIEGQRGSMRGQVGELIQNRPTRFVECDVDALVATRATVTKAPIPGETGDLLTQRIASQRDVFDLRGGAKHAQDARTAVPDIAPAKRLEQIPDQEHSQVGAHQATSNTSERFESTYDLGRQQKVSSYVPHAFRPSKSAITTADGHVRSQKEMLDSLPVSNVAGAARRVTARDPDAKLDATNRESLHQPAPMMNASNAAGAAKQTLVSSQELTTQRDTLDAQWNPSVSSTARASVVYDPHQSLAQTLRVSEPLPIANAAGRQQARVASDARDPNKQVLQDDLPLVASGHSRHIVYDPNQVPDETLRQTLHGLEAGAGAVAVHSRSIAFDAHRPALITQRDVGALQQFNGGGVKKSIVSTQDPLDATLRDVMAQAGGETAGAMRVQSKSLAYDPNDVPDATTRETTSGPMQLVHGANQQRGLAYDPNHTPDATLKDSTTGQWQLIHGSTQQKSVAFDPSQRPDTTLKDSTTGEWQMVHGANQQKGLAYDPNQRPDATLKESTTGQWQLIHGSTQQKSVTYDPHQRPDATLKDSTTGEWQLVHGANQHMGLAYDPHQRPDTTLKDSTTGEWQLVHGASQHKGLAYDPNNRPDATLKDSTTGQWQLVHGSTQHKSLAYDFQQRPDATLKDSTTGEWERVNGATRTKSLAYDPNQRPDTTLRESVLHETSGVVQGQQRGVVYDPNERPRDTQRQDTGPLERAVSTVRTRGIAYDPNDRPATTLKEGTAVEYERIASGVRTKGIVHDPNDMPRETLRYSDEMEHIGASGQQRGTVWRGADGLAKPTDRVTAEHVGHAARNRGAGYVSTKWLAKQTNKVDSVSHFGTRMSSVSGQNATRSSIFQYDASGAKEKTLFRYAPTPSGLKTYQGKDERYGSVLQKMSELRRVQQDTTNVEMVRATRIPVQMIQAPCVTERPAVEHRDDFAKQFIPMPRNNMVIQINPQGGSNM